MSRLRWKLQPKETGLRAVVAGPRSSALTDGATCYATVSALRTWSGSGPRYRGWYWVAGDEQGIPYKNTCNEPVGTVEQAKADAMAYVKQHLRAALTKANQSDTGSTT